MIKVCVFFGEELSDVVIKETSLLVTIPKVLVPIVPDINVWTLLVVDWDNWGQVIIVCVDTNLWWNVALMAADLPVYMFHDVNFSMSTLHLEESVCRDLHAVELEEYVSLTFFNILCQCGSLSLSASLDEQLHLMNWCGLFLSLPAKKFNDRGCVSLPLLPLRTSWSSSLNKTWLSSSFKLNKRNIQLTPSQTVLLIVLLILLEYLNNVN